MPVSRKPFVSPASRRMKELLSGDRRAIANKGLQERPKTKAEERAARALALARTRSSKRSEALSAARKGVTENPMRELERKERDRKNAYGQRGTSVARVKRHGNEEEEEDLELEEQIALDRSAAEAQLGIASPLPRSILRPKAPNLRRTNEPPGDWMPPMSSTPS